MKNVIFKIFKIICVIVGVLFLVFLIVFILATPWIFTQSTCLNTLNLSADSLSTDIASNIGEALGGITSPFIGILSIIAMFMAFYIQYRANKEVQKQFRINQFESQFYEMLKIHRENAAKEHDKIVSVVKNLRNNTLYEPLVGTVKLGRFKQAYEKHNVNEFDYYLNHLFLMVKLVVTQPDNHLTYTQKRDFLRMLRASIPSIEQTFLYLHWLSGYGKEWEDTQNHFFTDYRMIYSMKLYKGGGEVNYNIVKEQPFKDLLEKGKYKKHKLAKENDDDDLFEHYKKKDQSSN